MNLLPGSNNEIGRRHPYWVITKSLLSIRGDYEGGYAPFVATHMMFLGASLSSPNPRMPPKTRTPRGIAGSKSIAMKNNKY